MPVASVVIPAHNEEATIGRNLTSLRRGIDVQDLEVLVVCNGCTDDTAVVARKADAAAWVIEIPEPSKADAVRVGNAATDVFPRVHLDADIELSGDSLVALLAPLLDGRTLATAPRREIPRAGCSKWVGWYYDVWEQLPNVQAGLFGRGVVAVTKEGQERITALPRLLSDDLAMSDSFTDEERRVICDAVAVVYPPRTIADLVRRRIRVATGNVQATRAGARRPSSRTTVRALTRLAVAKPELALRMPVFMAVYAASAMGARRAVRAGDFTTWQRDESSRS